MQRHPLPVFALSSIIKQINMKQTSVTRNAPRLAWLARHRFLPALLGLITAMGIARLPAEDIRQGLISYWPLDAITPVISVQDVVSTNDMVLIAMDASNLVPGRYGNALSFDGTNTYALLPELRPDQQ